MVAAAGMLPAVAETPESVDDRRADPLTTPFRKNSRRAMSNMIMSTP